MEEELGSGWSYSPIQDVYKFNQGEWNITGDFVRREMKDWGRKIEKVHIISVLQRLYREAR